MKKIVFALILFLGLSLDAHSQVSSSVGFTFLSDHRGVDVGAVAGSIGYRIEGGSGWSFQPEISAGIGVIDDSVPGFSPVPPTPMVDVELDYLFRAAARVQYQPGSGAYLFVQPNLTRAELDGGGNLATRGLNDSNWEFGADLGAGFMFGERFGLEGSYGVLDGEPVFNAALRLYF